MYQKYILRVKFQLNLESKMLIALLALKSKKL